MADFSRAELFNCWVGGPPTPEEVSLWDALKVQGVRNVSETEGETRFEACDDCDAEMWSVYGRYRPSPQYAGCELITDGPRGDKAAAIAIAEHLGRLWGLPVHV